MGLAMRNGCSVPSGILTDDIKLSWTDLRSRAQNHDELLDDTKRKAIAAYDKLENVFCESLFDRQHPLFWFFVDRSGWRHEWAIWFAELLASLKAHPDYEFLVQKLKKPDFFSERMTVLKIAELLSAAGFLLRFDTPVLIGGDGGNTRMCALGTSSLLPHCSR
jgi:hypothetical protein